MLSPSFVAFLFTFAFDMRLFVSIEMIYLLEVLN